MANELDRPDDVDQLYLERGDPVAPWRPVLTGDVFRGPPVPGLDPAELTMIVAHPCTMREDRGRLRERLQAVPVRPYQEVPLDAWGTGYLKVFPLPEVWDGRSVAARLDEFGMVRTEQLDLDARVACLSEEGIRLLLQRFFACFARVTVGLSTLGTALLGPLTEAELLEDWNEALARQRVESGADRNDALTEEASEFDAVLSTRNPETGARLRDGLTDSVSASRVRREVREEIKRRLLDMPGNG